MFKVILTNGNEDCELVFKVRNSEIAKKWFDELKKEYELFETDRFSNWHQRDYVGELNKVIKIINSYDNIIDRSVSPITTQKDLNYLHKFFEDLRGSVEYGTEWYNTAPKEIKTAVRKFNVLIHNFEEDLRTVTKYPTVVVTFKNRPKYELNRNDMKHFTFRWTCGTVYINYCQIGKPVLDVFKDRDHITNAIRPQKYYSADFLIKFGPSSFFIVNLVRKLLIYIWMWWKKIDIKNANLGLIPVADLQTPVAIDFLKKFNRVKSVICLKK